MNLQKTSKKKNLEEKDVLKETLENYKKYPVPPIKFKTGHVSVKKVTLIPKKLPE